MLRLFWLCEIFAAEFFGLPRGDFAVSGGRIIFVVLDLHMRNGNIFKYLKSCHMQNLIAMLMAVLISAADIANIPQNPVSLKMPARGK